MIILKVIHGYPMRFNAGSEVYSQILCQGLADRHKVHVFTREEDIFKKDYEIHMEEDALDPRVLLHVVNLPKSRLYPSYRHPEVDQKFSELLDHLKPHIIHVGHLNHLSTSLIEVAHHKNIPIVFTLHDYWLMCPRGQFLQRNSQEPWSLCDGQEDTKCSVECFRGFYSGAPEDVSDDTEYWRNWVSNRMHHTKHVAGLVDRFIAPSKYLLKRYHEHFGIEEKKLTYLDYGFNLDRLKNRQRIRGEEPFTFGYIGTHIPAKGIQDLVIAFAKIKAHCLLRIWGRPREDTASLKQIVASLPLEVQKRIEWHSEYQNQEIVKDVFNHIDAIVVPSIWVENSPLVIHEALQVRVPVITADVGGMSEYVHHEMNGLLFRHRDVESLTEQMERLAQSPEFAFQLGMRGYLQSKDGNIPGIQQHIHAIESIYQSVLSEREQEISLKLGPWRITFDTNPDHCNFKCIMCECFSPYSDVKENRKKEGLPRREMDIQLIRRVLEEAQGTPLREIIPSTMGEPLLYKEFEEIIELCKQYNIKLNLTTNGSFPRKGAEKWAHLLVPVCSDIKISWNGATKQTQEKIMLGSNWERGLENLKTLIRVRDNHAEQGGNRCRITLQLTFLETNVDELPDIVKLAISLGVDRIKGHHLWAHFDEIKNLSMRRNAEAIEKWNEAVKKARSIASTHILANGQQILLEHVDTLSSEAVKDLAPGGLCPFLGEEAWINNEGRFSPCCAPDDLRKSLGDFGNLYETSMEEIWTSETYQKLRKNYKQHSLCISCNMRKPLN